MRRYFAAIGDKAQVGSGFPLAVISGNSISDNKDWCVETLAMSADEVPEVCADSRLFSKLVAGLLNFYYNDLETKDRTEEQIMKMGDTLSELEIPNPANPLLPFPADDATALYETRLVLSRLLRKMQYIQYTYENVVTPEAAKAMEQAKQILHKYSNIKDCLR